MAPKKKQEKMNLGEFLTNQSLGSWADEMDSQPIVPAVPATSGYGRDRDGGERRAFTQPAWETARTGSGVGGGMGGRGASYDRPRFAEREQLPLPTKPPYTAHLGNLTYDVSQAEIEGFFKDCQVTNVRIVEDKIDHKPKGFGYVEFATLDGLKQALTLTETNFMGRNVKISVAEPPKDRPEATARDMDWGARRGPLPDLPQNTRQPSRGFSRNFNDNMSDAGSERGGGRRPGFFEGDGKVRDFNNWEKKGPLSPVPNAGPPMRDGGRVREGGPPRERRQSPAWGEGRSDAGSRPPRREFEPRPPVERVPTAAEQDNQWRSGMRPDPSPVATPDVSTPSSPQQQAAPPKERPKLNLTKRTVSAAVDEPAASAATDSKASPFGAARPIDTASKEREIEEKRQLAIRQKKEADEKAKAEKAANEAAARAARADRADRGQSQEDVVTSPILESGKGRRASRQQNGTKQAPKENGEAPTPTAPKPSFAILQRDIAGGDESEGIEGQEEPAGEEEANGSIASAQLPDGGNTDSAQNIVEAAVQEPTLSAKDVADGWETVAAKPKNNRRQRPVAS